MPLDRSTAIGPFRIEVVEPIRTIRYVVEPNDHGIECDLTFRATTVAIEEPRQRTMSPEGILTMDHTRLTQWGTWEGVVSVDGDELRIDPDEVPGTRDRSWGMRSVGQQLTTNWGRRDPQAFWLWAPLHFDRPLSPTWLSTSTPTARAGSRPRSCSTRSPTAPHHGAPPG